MSLRKDVKKKTLKGECVSVLGNDYKTYFTECLCFWKIQAIKLFPIILSDIVLSAFTENTFEL